MKTPVIILILILTGQLHAQQSNMSVLGNVDFYALLNAVPVLQTSPESAFEYTSSTGANNEGYSQLKIDFDNYNKMKEAYANQKKSAYATKVNTFKNKYSADDYKKQANQNDLVQRMGGMDKINQMSSEEREQAAKMALASKASASKFNSFTEADMQRMMNDPTYAKQMMAKYKTMTEGQREDLANKKIAAGDLDDSKEAYEQRLKDKKDTKNLQNINGFVSKTTSRLYEAYEACSLKIYQAKSTSGSHDELDESYDELFEKIPVITVWDGKVKEPKMLKELNLEYALKHKKRAELELSEVQVEHKKLKSIINEVISDYQSFLDTNGYRVNGKISSLFNGTNTELSLMQVEESIVGSIDKLADISSTEDKLASNREQHYQLILSEQ